jgi:hypothetical protein
MVRCMTAVSLPLLSVGAALIVAPVFAFGVRRLIGVRLPVLRTVAAGIIAVLVFSPIVTAMVGGPAFPRKGSVLPALWFVILGVVIALLTGMVFLVIAEALVPSGSVPGPVYLLHGMRRRMGRAGRYWQISRILARRGLLPYQQGGRRSELATPEGRARLARSVRLAMEDGGVTFVKLGQVLSTRRDLLPAEFNTELSRAPLPPSRPRPRICRCSTATATTPWPASWSSTGTSTASPTSSASPRRATRRHWRPWPRYSRARTRRSCGCARRSRSSTTWPR